VLLFLISVVGSGAVFLFGALSFCNGLCELCIGATWILFFMWLIGGYIAPIGQLLMLRAFLDCGTVYNKINQEMSRNEKKTGSQKDYC